MNWQETPQEIAPADLDHFAQNMLGLLVEWFLKCSQIYLFQLQEEELVAMASWRKEDIIEALYLALTDQIGKIYVYLKDWKSLLILNGQQACPLYASDPQILEGLKTDCLRNQLDLRDNNPI
ncbi:hypothetical protein ACVR1I_02425 [Streptococcus cameli]